MKGTMMIANRYSRWSVRARLWTTILLALAWTQLASAQRAFETPEAAAQAVVEAAKANDENALIDIFGAKYRSLVATVDHAADQANREKFARAAAEHLVLRPDGDNKVTIVAGFEAWPLPIPIVREGASWHFDAAAGSEEILNRRIGRNELAAIELLRAYVQAQRQYASKPRDGSHVRAFARKVASSPGKRDGLYWPAHADRDEEMSPFGPLIQDPGKHKASEPYNGYYFKILTRQGAAAPGGAYSYIINGRMVAGYAMVAAPARYGQTGIKTFIVNHYGDVYEADLGPDTLKKFNAMTEYNPTSKWQLTQ
jgi:hypothetical protein